MNEIEDSLASKDSKNVARADAVIFVFFSSAVIIFMTSHSFFCVILF